MTFEELRRFAGGYRWIKYPKSDIGKVIALIPGPHNLTVEATEDGALALFFFGAAPRWHYAPVEPLVFRQVEGGPQEVGNLLIDPGETLVFREDEGGDISHGFLSLQNAAFERLAWYERPATMLGTFAVLIILFLSPLIVWPITSLVQRLRKSTDISSKLSRRMRRLAGLMSALNVVFLFGIFMTFGEGIVYGPSVVLLVLLAIPIVAIILAVGVVAAAVMSWRRSYWSIFGRVHYSIIAVAAIVFVLWANYWNLLGYRI